MGLGILDQREGLLAHQVVAPPQVRFLRLRLRERPPRFLEIVSSHTPPCRLDARLVLRRLLFGRDRVVISTGLSTTVGEAPVSASPALTPPVTRSTLFPGGGVPFIYLQTCGHIMLAKTLTLKPLLPRLNSPTARKWILLKGGSSPTGLQLYLSTLRRTAMSNSKESLAHPISSFIQDELRSRNLSEVDPVTATRWLVDAQLRDSIESRPGSFVRSLCRKGAIGGAEKKGQQWTIKRISPR